MKKVFLIVFLLVAVICSLSMRVGAIPVYSTGAGNSVTTVNYSAKFDPIVTGMSLLNYTEDNLIVSIDDYAHLEFSPGPGFDNKFHYGSGGNYSYVTIKTADSKEIIGLEFILGNGYGTSGYMGWEIYDNNILVNSGNSGLIARGTVVGWKDIDGFDELRVGCAYSQGYTFGQHQAIAIDNVNVQTEGDNAVPEPASIIFLGIGLAGLAGKNIRKKK